MEDITLDVSIAERSRRLLDKIEELRIEEEN